MKTPVLLLSFCLLTSYVSAQLFSDAPQTLLQNEVCEPLYSFATDLDEDGLMDVLVASQSDSKVYWYRNVGDQVYERQLLLEDSIRNPYVIEIIDIEQDGDTDIIIGDFNGWGVLVNDGDATFTTFQAIGQEISSSNGLEAVDIDQDGDEDIFATGGREAWLSINDGNGQFTHISLPNDLNFRGFKTRIANLDDSPEMEIVLQSASFTPSSSLAIYKYYPENKLLRLQKSISLRVGQQFSLSDYDGDGLMDILFIQSGLNWAKNLENLNFAAPIQIAGSNQVNFTDFTMADYNQDGIMDYFLSELRRGSSGGIQLYIGTDSSTLLKVENHPSVDKIGGFSSLQAVDMDGDQDVDLLITEEWTNNVYWLEFTGERFTKRLGVIESLVRQPLDLQKVDMDSDGDFDLLMRPNQDPYLSWLPNELEEGFGDLKRIDLDYSISKIAFGDLDNDGDQDAVLSTFMEEDESSSLGFIINDQQLFDSPLQEIVAEGFFRFTLGDIDKDNDIDILGYQVSSRSLLWFENDNLSFKRHPIVENIRISDVYQIVDLNNDSYQDIVYVTRIEGENIDVVFGNQLGGFDPPIRIAENLYIILDIKAVDLDQNGHKELLVNSVNAFDLLGGLILFSNDNQDEVWETEVISPLTTTQSVVLDVNNDENLDIIMIGTESGLNNHVYYYLQDSLNQFSRYELEQNSLAFTDFLEIEDFNQDGDQDLVIGSISCEQLVYFENQTIVISNIQEFQNQANFRLFPNPVLDVLTIETEDTEWIGKAQFQLYNSVGALMKAERLEGFRQQVSLGDLPKGIYFYTIRDLSGKGLASGKIVK